MSILKHIALLLTLGSSPILASPIDLAEKPTACTTTYAVANTAPGLFTRTIEVPCNGCKLATAHAAAATSSRGSIPIDRNPGMTGTALVCQPTAVPGPCARVRCAAGTTCVVYDQVKPLCVETKAGSVTLKPLEEGEGEPPVVAAEGKREEQQEAEQEQESPSPVFSTRTINLPRPTRPPVIPTRTFEVPRPTRSPIFPPPTEGSVKCGKATCKDGFVCCNWSCGICAPKNGACIQIFCEDGKLPWGYGDEGAEGRVEGLEES